MFVRLKNNVPSPKRCIYLSAIFRTLRCQPDQVYKVSRVDGKAPVEAGLFEEVPADQVTTYLIPANPHKFQDASEWGWKAETKSLEAE